MNKKIIGKQICFVLASVLFCGTAYAAGGTEGYTGPGASRSEAEWATLRDNTLEWNEIDGLVEEYDPQILESFASYRNRREYTGTAEEVARDMNMQAAALEDQAALYDMETGGQLTAASLRIQAKELRESAVKNTQDRETIWLEMLEKLTAEKKTVREQFVAYYEACSEVENNRAETGRLEQELSYLKKKKAKGKATAEEVRSAERSLDAAGRKTALLQAKRDKAYRELIVSCGWSQDSAAVIGGLPEAEGLLISETQRETDVGKALENSYLLRTDRIRLENAQRIYGEGEIKAELEKQLAEDTVTVRDTVKETLGGMDDAAQALILAKEDLSRAEKTLELTTKRKESGLVSEEMLSKKKDAVSRARETVENARYDLIRARIAYDAVMEGASL